MHLRFDLQPSQHEDTDIIDGLKGRRVVLPFLEHEWPLDQVCLGIIRPVSNAHLLLHRVASTNLVPVLNHHRDARRSSDSSLKIV